MILTVDIGNSNVCFALHSDSGDALFFERVHTNREKSAAAYREDLEMILKLHGISGKDVKKAGLSSVVSALTEVLKSAVESVIPAPVLIIENTLNFPFENHADDPATVGHDILCDLTGALTMAQAPILTIDMGTATVMSILLPAGTEDSVVFPGRKSPLPSLSGVLIQAGVQTSLNSLANDTSALPDISLKAPANVIGRNTVDGMKSGIVFGTASMIDGMIERIERETGLHFTVFATGGLSKFIIPYCKKEIILDPNLLMKGMMELLKRN